MRNHHCQISIIFSLILLIANVICSREIYPERLKEGERHEFVESFLKTFFHELDEELQDSLINCVAFSSMLSMNAAEGIFKYQQGHTYADRIVALSLIGMEFGTLAVSLRNCQDQFQAQIQELENAESHFVHPTTMDHYGHSLVLNDNEIAEPLTRAFHSFNIRHMTQFGQYLGNIAVKFRDYPGEQHQLDADDINLFMLVENLFTSVALGKGSPRPIFMLLADTGKQFFTVVNTTIPERYEGLNKTELYNIKMALLGALKDVFVHIVEKLGQDQTSEREYLIKIRDCLIDEQKQKDDFIIEVLIKNMLTYLKTGDYNMASRFMMSTYLGPCTAPKPAWARKQRENRQDEDL